MHNKKIQKKHTWLIVMEQNEKIQVGGGATRNTRIQSVSEVYAH